MIYIENGKTVRWYDVNTETQKAIKVLLDDSGYFSAETQDGYEVVIAERKEEKKNADETLLKPGELDYVMLLIEDMLIKKGFDLQVNNGYDNGDILNISLIKKVPYKKEYETCRGDYDYEHPCQEICDEYEPQTESEE